MNELRIDPSETPSSVRGAANVLLAYGCVVLLSATALQVQNDWVGISEYPRAVLRAVGMGLLWFGLRRRVAAAWWVAVGLASLWAATGVLAAVALSQIGVASTDLGGLVVVSILSILLLVAAVVLLLLPRSRAAFRKGAV